jgi:adenylate cyclase
MRHPQLTLGRFIVACFAGGVVLLAVLLSVFYEGSRRTLLVTSERLMAQASRRIAERLEGHLGEAERVVASIEEQLRLGVVSTAVPETIEPALIAALIAHEHVTEVTLTIGRAVGTYADRDGVHDPGDLRLADEGRAQVSVARQAPTPGIAVRRLAFEDGAWIATLRQLPSAEAVRDTATAPADPTHHATFTVPARREFHGQALWSDLAYAEADAALPEPDRRRVVSVQKALWSRDGTFVGVLRVALLSDRIDELVRVRVDEGSSSIDEHVVFIADRHGRLVSRLSPADRFALLDANGAPDEDGAVRVVPSAGSPALIAALRTEMRREVPTAAETLERISVDGVPHLVRFAGLLGDRTRDWLVGIVVPEAHYLNDLAASRRHVLLLAAALMLAGIAGGALVVRAIRGDLGRLTGEMARLRTFDFAPARTKAAAFGDVQEAADSLEQAKTALRALGKYAPLDLVRQLYEARMEPTLGGRLQEVTLLFSDIEGFTSVSERLSPNTLATALGDYLETMTRAIHATGGIIDKYTGDGVMALWNTPRAHADHARRACEAALACCEATQQLFASPAWAGLAPWRTRFGIHRAEVTVGHFGAPDRMSFTAMGDGVNLASRLEGLGKQYGTSILVSADVEREARDAFVFRRLDRVAVKGRHEGIEVFELLGRRAPGEPRPEVIDRYERALCAYFARDFRRALDLLTGAGGDAPSRVLAARCERYLRAPPPAGWTGIHVAQEK